MAQYFTGGQDGQWQDDGNYTDDQLRDYSAWHFGQGGSWDDLLGAARGFNVDPSRITGLGIADPGLSQTVQNIQTQNANNTSGNANMGNYVDETTGTTYQANQGSVQGQDVGNGAVPATSYLGYDAANEEPGDSYNTYDTSGTQTGTGEFVDPGNGADLLAAGVIAAISMGTLLPATMAGAGLTAAGGEAAAAALGSGGLASTVGAAGAGAGAAGAEGLVALGEAGGYGTVEGLVSDGLVELGGLTEATLAGPTLSKAALDGTNVFGANSIPGALDISSLVSAAPGLESATALDEIVNSLTTPTTFNPAQDSELANRAIEEAGGNPLDGYTNPEYGLPTETPTLNNPFEEPPPFDEEGFNDLPTDTVDPTVPPVPPGNGSDLIDDVVDSGNDGGGNGGSGLNLSSLFNLLGGLDSRNRTNHASDDMLNWLNGQQAKVDGLYAPDSPEFNKLWDEMSRKDAASGRNSQYGPRSVDLASKIAQIKADATVKMTTGIGSTYAAAINQGANANNNMWAGLGDLLQSGNGGDGFDLSDLGDWGSDIWDGLTGLFD